MAAGDPIHVLFLCTRNNARSLMAEATLNALGKSRFRAWSAGSWPKEGGRPDPLALEVLETAAFSAAGLRSKSWDEFTRPGAPRIDLVVTLCDAIADEPCPVWPAHPSAIHWSYADPAAATGSDADRLHAYRNTLHDIHWRVELFANLPEDKIEHVVAAEYAKELAGRSRVA